MSIRFLAVAVLALGACTIVNRGPALVNAPFSVRGVKVPPEALNSYLESRHGFTSAAGQMRCAYTPLGQSGNRLFVWALCLERLVMAGPADPVSGSGLSTPAAFTVHVSGSEVQVVGVELPEVGAGYNDSLRRMFPESVLALVNVDATQQDARRAVLQEHLTGASR